MEDVHRLLQLPARGRHRRREDLLLPRRPQPRPPVHGADQEDHEAHRRPRPGPPLRPPLVGPGQGTVRGEYTNDHKSENMSNNIVVNFGDCLGIDCSTLPNVD